MADAAPPRHIAIIMDGNGRWAKARGLHRVAGHAEGVHSVRAVVRECRALGVEALTLYSFSTENWKRPAAEVDALMGLLVHYLEVERSEILDNGIRLSHAGDATRLPANVQEALFELEAASAHCDRMVLNLALSYGAREEITRAVRSIAGRVARGELAVDDIVEATIDASLDTAGLPDPDLVIRTSGELRLSNFLLWQVAYAELYVTDVAWPDFREEQLHEALAAFGQRERRFGRTGEQLTVQEK